MVNYRKVAVLMGGVSSEREVSLRSGECIARGLEEAGCDVSRVVLDAESVAGLIPGGTEAVFIALHGGYGENGGVQRDLDAMGLKYTGPGAAASALAMDKWATKRVFNARGISTPRGTLANVGDAPPRDLAFPLVVKPRSDGSSVGLTCPCGEGEWGAALEKAAALGEGVLVEEYIPGKEWTVGLIGGRPLPVIEIAPKGGVYDYGSKYTKGATTYTPLDETPLTRECQAVAVRAFEAIGARGLARVDFRVTPSGRCLALEVNTVPGFTETSLVPKAAAKAGMSFSETCLAILSLAACDAGAKAP
ncbi:MAG: D-alanine--D-alanine ligase [Kiritimatiellae bacterium]|nr:D-alanine--D-alanine ligase [Kiritimatiellia bacterium]